MFSVKDRIRNWLADSIRELTRYEMPLNYYEIRHGESEGNVLKGLQWDQIPAGMKAKLSCYYRLTDEGIRRAKLVGQYFQENFEVDVVLYSIFSRAEETAFYLGINAPHEMRPELRERGYGSMDRPGETAEEEEERIACFRGRKVDPMYWSAGGGEMIVDVMGRYYQFYQVLHRKYSRLNVGSVLHGETMMGNAALMHRWAAEDLKDHVVAQDPLVKIENCQINHWSRVNPSTGKIHRHIEWVRVLRPWDLEFMVSDSARWRKIERAKRERAQLPELFERHERFIS